ncbi:hypothetical protein [Halobellus clavatus]|uniref:DUF7998 domain-containing protein n=1 Tax=Halobellus clavatus TaxID=660517 RepID=A0A1H3FMW7_9EURY|nr:hypothetical protein [Halobellus clavatus]SDX91738.1 hypothetical protein SAMN04487946_10431 [Halobellus clavatus]
MVEIPSPLGGRSQSASFDRFDEFVPEHLPEPGPFLKEADVLDGEAHAAVHRVTREVFEARGVYDMTFGYNLAKLNLDTRHPDAGYRYGEGDDDVLRAEFTPTTPFCPQSNTLAVGSFRAWNGRSDRHEYDVVRVRVHPMHHNSASINERLHSLEQTYRQTGTVPETAAGEDRPAAESGTLDDEGAGATGPASGPNAPF